MWVPLSYEYKRLGLGVGSGYKLQIIVLFLELWDFSE